MRMGLRSSSAPVVITEEEKTDGEGWVPRAAASRNSSGFFEESKSGGGGAWVRSGDDHDDHDSFEPDNLPFDEVGRVMGMRMVVVVVVVVVGMVFGLREKREKRHFCLQNSSYVSKDSSNRSTTSGW